MLNLEKMNKIKHLEAFEKLERSLVQTSKNSGK